MVMCAFLAFIIERIAYKPLRTAPRISALITAIGVSFFLEYFGALPFVYTSNFITYKRPFPVQNWAISAAGDHTIYRKYRTSTIRLYIQYCGDYHPGIDLSGAAIKLHCTQNPHR